MGNNTTNRDPETVFQSAPSEGSADIYRVDPTVCEAYGMCFDVAGDIFDGDDWGYAQISKLGTLTDAEKARAEEAFRICPVKAIRRLAGNH